MVSIRLAVALAALEVDEECAPSSRKMADTPELNAFVRCESFGEFNEGAV